MKLGIRGKLFLVSVTVVMAVVVGSGLYLSHSLRSNLEERIRSEVRRHAQVAAEIAGRAEGAPELARLTRRLATATGMRTTIKNSSGAIVADSGAGSVPGGSVEFVELDFSGSAMTGRVRVSKPLAEVDAAVAKLRWLVFVAGAVGLVLAVVMSFLALRLLAGPLREILDRTRDANTGDQSSDAGPQVPAHDSPGSIHQMAHEVETTVAELAKERALVKAVLKGMSEAVIALDNDRRVTLMNPSAVELLDLEAVPIGRSILEVLRVPTLQQLVGDLPSSGSESAEFNLPNGRHVLASIRPQRGSEGAVLVMHDITDIRRLETVRRDFVANVSHELRTPVAIIRANAETLLAGALEDPKFRGPLVDALHRNAERLNNIVADLLDLSRIEAGRYQLAQEDVPVADVADLAAKGIERTAAEKEISIDVEVSSATRVRADPKALEQVLFNLLDNAVKYTPEGGRIRIGSEASAAQHRLFVEDNGPGIEPRYRKRIFERFYRVDPGRSRDRGGTGLGLAIVKHLIESMGGKVYVAGAKPHGSRFIIELDAAPALVEASKNTA